MQTPIKHVIFDLDDTLFDTTGQLLEPAFDDVLTALQRAHFPMSAKALQHQFQLIRSKETSSEDIISQLIAENAKKDQFNFFYEIAHRSFYQRDHVSDIFVFEGVYEMLARLKTRVQLSLVTLGHPPTQLLKIKKLKLGSYFTKIIYVNNLKDKQKRAAFEDLLEENAYHNHEVLVVGNRLDKEIQDANSLNLQTCHLLHGESAFAEPQSPLQKPDFQIQHILEVERICLN